MAWFGGIGEFEGAHSVLHHVWKGQETAFSRDDGAEILDLGTVVFDVVDFLDGAVVVLSIWEVEAVVYLLPEGEE